MPGRVSSRHAMSMRRPATGITSLARSAVRADVRGLGQGEHYGRPYAWRQQAAKRNFLAAWAEVDAPVLVIFNEFDQYETRHGHKLIADTANRLRPGSGTFVEQKGIDHSDTKFPTIEAAYADEGGTPVPPAARRANGGNGNASRMLSMRC